MAAHLKYKSGNSWVDYNLVVYPVGALYISYSSTSPASLFGGTWTPITGRFPYFNAGTGTGGSNSHTHSLSSGYAGVGYDFSNSPNLQFSTKGTQQWSANGVLMEWTWQQIARAKTGTITKAMGTPLYGTSDSASNMPSYQTFYAWRRTA